MKKLIPMIFCVVISITLILGCSGDVKDTDGDGWSDKQEENAGTSPTNPDTDGDGYWDSKDENPLDENIPSQTDKDTGISTDISEDHEEEQTITEEEEQDSVTPEPIPSPKLLSPQIGDYDISVNPKFTWAAVPGVTSYELMVSEDPTFTIIEWVVNVGAQTSYQSQNVLAYDTTYYWRVSAIAGTQQGSSTIGIFTTQSVPVLTGPNLIAPEIEAYDISISPDFTWTAVPGAIKYEIMLSKDPTFTIIEWAYNVDSTIYSPDENLRYDTTYFWRVRAIAGTQQGPYATGIFTTEVEPVPTGPSLITPEIEAYNIPISPDFTWTTVLGAIRYEIALSEDPTFTIIEWAYNIDDTIFTPDEDLRYNTTYYWRVRGILDEPYQEDGQWKIPSTPWTTGIFTTEVGP